MRIVEIRPNSCQQDEDSQSDSNNQPADIFSRFPGENCGSGFCFQLMYLGLDIFVFYINSI